MFESLRRPEYTGENRCLPCTAVNAVVVVLASTVVGLLSPLVGLAVFVLGVVLIVLRGYVVPYTPSFAPQLTAKLPFDFGPSHVTDGGRTSESLAGDEADLDGETLIQRLAEAGVVVADESGDLFLADDVRRTWEAGMSRLRGVSDSDLAMAAADAAPFDADGRSEANGDWIVVTRIDDDADVWLSRAHAVAETAAVAALTSEGLDKETAAQAATPLRLFLQSCPACGGPVEETTVSDCCGGTMGLYDNPETPVLACAECGEVLYEF